MTSFQQTGEPQGALNFLVPDMNCGHCAGAIRKAVEAGMPGARVEADPATKRVTVLGAGDAAAVQALIVAAGYTPSAA